MTKSAQRAPFRRCELQTRCANLPIYSTSFIGRNREFPELCEMLNQPDTRLLAVIGFGGRGKTCRILQLAERCSSAFTDGAGASRSIKFGTTMP